MTDKLHVDELLTYACYYINNSAIENIKKIILNFHNNEEILNSKKLLWNVSGEYLTPYKDRKSTENRSSMEANISDIFEAIIQLDATNKLPKFVAINLGKVPDKQPEHLNLISMINRISNIERTLVDHADTLSQHEIDLHQFKSLDIENRFKDIENIKDQVKETYLKNELSKEPSTTKTDDLSSDSEWETEYEVPSPKRSKTGIGKKNINLNKEKYIVRNGYTLAESKSKKKKRLQAANKDKLIQGAPPTIKHIYIGRLSEGNEATIKKYLQLSNVPVENVQQLSRQGSKFKSFKLSVDSNFVNQILEENFWPRGVYARRWQDNAGLSYQKRYDSSPRRKTFIPRELNHEDWDRSRNEFINSRYSKYSVS